MLISPGLVYSKVMGQEEPMPTFQQLTSAISKTTSGTFQPAARADLTKLARLGVPESILAFYREFEPEDCVEGQVRLWNIEHIVQENTDLTPGYVVQPLGYVVFATTLCGDTYCFDLTGSQRGEIPIVLISHETIGEGMTLDEVQKVAKPIARSLNEFLQQFASNEIDEECIY